MKIATQKILLSILILVSSVALSLFAQSAKVQINQSIITPAPACATDTRTARDEIVVKAPTDGSSVFLRSCSNSNNRVELKTDYRIVPLHSTDTYFGAGVNPENSYGAVNNSTSYTIDKTKPFGNTDVMVKASQTGGATFSVPIDLPTGPNGLKPNLSIVYNSQTDQGILGIGTELQGISTINRVGQNIFLDGAQTSVNLTSTDRFVLDGNRLLLKNTTDTYGGNNVEYLTESETYMSIKGFGDMANGTYYFVVTDKNGTLFEYASSIYAAGVRSANEPAYAWNLSKTKDINGNEIRYLYDNVDGVAVISRIEYGEADNFITIKFQYVPRADKRPLNISNFGDNAKTIAMSALLKDIIVKVESNLYKQYAFDYEHVREYSKLNTINVKDPLGSKWNPIKISWNQPNNTFTTDQSSFPSFTGTMDKWFTGDYDGDGLTEFVIFSVDNIHLYEKNTDNTFIYLGGALRKQKTGDITDEIVDLVQFRDEKNNIDKAYFKFKNYNSSTRKQTKFGDFNQSSFTATSFTLPTASINSLVTVDYKFHVVGGDFNGDRKLDVFFIDNTIPSQSQSTDFQLDEFSNHINNFCGEYIVTDINGDNINEIMTVDNKNSKTYIHRYNNTNKNFVRTEVEYTGFINNQKPVLADFNGDGKTDILGLFNVSKEAYKSHWKYKYKFNAVGVSMNDGYTGGTYVECLIFSRRYKLSTQFYEGEFQYDWFPNDTPPDFNGENLDLNETYVYGNSKYMGSVVQKTCSDPKYPNPYDCSYIAFFPIVDKASGLAGQAGLDKPRNIFYPSNFRYVNYAKFSYTYADCFSGEFETYIDHTAKSSDNTWSRTNIGNSNLLKNTWKLFNSIGNKQVLNDNTVYTNIVKKILDDKNTVTYYEYNDVVENITKLTQDAYDYLSNDNNRLLASDFSGDGVADILRAHKTNFNGTTSSYNFRIGVTKGTDFDVFNYSIAGVDIPLSSVQIIDFDNDGTQDIVYWENISKKLKVLYFDRGGLSRYVATVTNSMGHTTKFNYMNTSSAVASQYTPSAQTNLPANVIKYTKPMVLLDYTEFNTGTDPSNMQFTTYSYSGAKYHTLKNSFLGFESIRIASTQDNLNTTTEFENMSNSFVLLPKKIIVQNNGTGRTISQSDFINNTYQANSAIKNFFSYTSQKIETNFVYKQKTKTDYTYGNLAQGELTNIETKVYDTKTGTDVLQHTSIENRVFDSFSGFRRIKTLTNTQTRTGETAFSTSESYNYDEKGQNTEIKKYDTDADYKSSINKLYDKYGNVTNVQVKAKKLAPSQAGTQEVETRSTTSEYGFGGRFVVSETNPIGHKTIYERDRTFGNILSATSPNGLKTTYAYSQHNRELQTTQLPDGTLKTISTVFATDGPTGSVYKTVAEVSGITGTEIKWYDTNGNLLREQTQHLNGVIYTDYSYDLLNRIVTKTAPYFSTASPLASQNTVYEYYAYDRDDLQRLKKVTSLHGWVAYSYDDANRKVIQTDHNSKTTETTTDATGKTLTIKDQLNNTISHTYFSHGGTKNTIVTTGASTATTSYTYHATTAAKIGMTEPSFGTLTYSYNGFGELAYQKDGKNNATWFYYDIIGNLTKKTTADGDYTYTYNTEINNAALLMPTAIVAPNGNATQLVYDNLGRITSKTEKVGTREFAHAYTYDAYSRLSKTTYPNDFNTTNTYDAKGFLKLIKSNNNTTKLWEAGTENQLGQPLTYTLGNGLTTRITYDTYFKPTQNSVYAGTIANPTYKLNYQYQFEGQKDQLTLRRNLLNTRKEIFTYDQDRLQTATSYLYNIVEQPHLNYATSYSPNGNIASKTNLGTYTYGHSTNPYALTQLPNVSKDALGTPLYFSNNEQNISYTVFNKVNILTEGVLKYQWTYGPDDSRRTMLEYTNNVLDQTTYYLDNYERIEKANGTTLERTYIDCPYGQIAYVLNGVQYYTHADYQGTVLALSNQTGTVVETHSYDAWGQHRNPDTWAIEKPASTAIYTRGYTNHEHLYAVNLVNMNGRMYDPALGRFLSPDPALQFADNSQNYNRYSYVLNNPLIYTDPSGYNLLGFIGSLFVSLGKSVAIGAVNYSLQITSNMINNGMTFSQAAAASSFTIGYSFTPQWGMGRQQNINAGMIEPRNMINSYDGYKQYLQQGMAGGKPQEGKQYFQSFEEWYGNAQPNQTRLQPKYSEPFSKASDMLMFSGAAVGGSETIMARTTGQGARFGQSLAGGLKKMGYAGLFASLGIDGYNLILNKGNYESRARVMVGGIITGIGFVPVAGVPLSFMLGTYEMKGGFNAIYKQYIPGSINASPLYYNFDNAGYNFK